MRATVRANPKIDIGGIVKLIRSRHRRRTHLKRLADHSIATPALAIGDGRLTSTPAVRFAEIGLLTRKVRYNDFRCK